MKSRQVHPRWGNQRRQASHQVQRLHDDGLAIELGADAADVGLTIRPHPTLSESIGMTAEALEGTLTDLYMPKKG